MNAIDNFRDSSHGRNHLGHSAKASSTWPEGYGAQRRGKSQQGINSCGGDDDQAHSNIVSGHEVVFSVILALYSSQQARKSRIDELEQFKQLVVGRDVASVVCAPCIADDAALPPAPADDLSWTSPALVDGPGELEKEQLWEVEMECLVCDLREAREAFPSAVRRGSCIEYLTLNLI